MNDKTDLLEFKGVERNKFLREWCNQQYGRTSVLSERIFPDIQNPKCGMSHYKNKREIGDDLWSKMVAEILVLDALRNGVSKTEPKSEEPPELHNDPIYADLDQWLSHNREIKLVMSDAFYQFAHNEELVISKIHKREKFIGDVDSKRVREVIRAVNMSIIARDQYYVAAMRSI